MTRSSVKTDNNPIVNTASRIMGVAPRLVARPQAARPAVLPGKALYLRRSKRIFDIAGAVALIVFFAPLFIILYALVRRDGGPGFFAHRRIGAGGETFMCLKFRTMVVDADRVLAEVLARDPDAAAAWKKDYKLRQDPRITPIGHILRITSLDELPQLFNVLKGEMSLIGPRPIVRDEMARYGAKIVDYLSCRPGLTGLWQVSGRNDVSYTERVNLDAHYARKWSMGLDLVILFKTIGVVINRTGAY